MKPSGFTVTKTKLALARGLLVAVMIGSAVVVAAQTQQSDEGPGGRHICPVQAIRNGTCDPNPGKNKRGQSSAREEKKQPQYKRVAKQTSTVPTCNKRVTETQIAKKNQSACKPPTQLARRDDLPLTAQRVGITIWKVREVLRGYNGARILSHPQRSGTSVEYQAERMQGDPLLAYGDKVRLAIESPRDGYLYVFDRELYEDGSLSAAYMIFPTTRLREGNNRIRANQPVEIPSLKDDPFYFEAKKIGLNPKKKLVGEVLSIAITDKPIAAFKDFGRDVMQVSSDDMQSVERLYSAKAEVFELEEGVGKPYSTVERDAANLGTRLLTHADPVPQTFYLVEDKNNGGLLVSLALKYEEVRDRFAHRPPKLP